MRIGDLAERTGVAARMIRYYEAQGLLEPARGANGYRVYGDGDVGRVLRIRSHVAAGIPTRVVRILLEMDSPAWTDACSQDFAAMLGDEVAALDDRIACLTLSRDSLRDYLAQVRVAGIDEPGDG